MFGLYLYKPLQRGQAPVPVTYLDINPKLINLQWTTTDPGGYGALEVGITPYASESGGVEQRALPRGVEVGHFYHVRLKYGQFQCFEGRVMGLDRSGAGEVSGFSAQGYGVCAIADQAILSTRITPKTSGTLVREVLGEAAPLLQLPPVNSGMFVDPGIYHQKGDFNALYPADVINQVIREGGNIFSAITTSAGGVSPDAGVWQWLVYEGRKIQFRPRLPPANTPDDPAEWSSVLDERTTWHEDAQSLYGQVRVRFTNIGKGGAVNITAPVSDPTFVPRYGSMRSAVLEGGSMRESSALAFAANYLANRRTPTFSVRLVRAQLQSFYRWGIAAGYLPYMVRAGEWIVCGDQPPQPIISTTYDAFQETLQVEAGSPLPTGSHLVRTLSKVAASVVRKVNPTTGGRA